MEPLPVIFAALSLALAGRPQQISGEWITQDRTAVVLVAPCGSRVCGRIAKILARGANVPTTDIHNSQRSLRNRTLVGMPILTGFSPKGSRFEGGRAYDPKTGRSYRSILQLNPNGTLLVKGCVAFICRSQQWSRRGK